MRDVATVATCARTVTQIPTSKNGVNPLKTDSLYFGFRH